MGVKTLLLVVPLLWLAGCDEDDLCFDTVTRNFRMVVADPGA